MRLTIGFLGMVVASNAWAQTTEQNNVLKHVSEAIVLEHYCPTMRVNTEAKALIMVGYGISDADVRKGGKFFADMRQRVADADAQVAHLQPEAACAVATLMFGAQGGNVPNLMQPR